MAKPNIPSPESMRTRHCQALAQIAALQARLLADIRKDQAETQRRIVEQNQIIHALRPQLQAWQESALDPQKKPSDEELRQYVHAVKELHELQLADNAARLALEEYEEMRDPEISKKEKI